MNQVVTIMMALIKSVICDELVDKNLIEQITPEVRKELYSLSKSHDLAHLVAYALKKEKALGEDELSELFSKSIYVAVARYANIVVEQEKICNVLEQYKIPYVPLKGAVIRDYYPEPWMRTSCDIDILIHEENLTKAEDVLVKELEYRMEERNYHDVSAYSPTGVHLELHFNILEYEENVEKLFKCVWDYVLKAEGKQFLYEMQPEYFMFYLVGHMWQHFMCGGCGVRTFVDIFLLNQKYKYDKKLLGQYCEESGLEIFAAYVEKLTQVWFGNLAHDEITLKMETFVVLGGIYGNKETLATVRSARAKNKVNYALKRIFISYRELCIAYPRLQSKPVLYPYYWFVRCCKLLDKSAQKRIAKELSDNRQLGQQQINELKEIFEKFKL